MRSAMLLALVLGLSGCASIIDGSSQSVSVKTVAKGVDVAAASCEMKNDKGTWYVTTPGTVTVHRSYDDINVKCSHDGYTPSIVSIKSTTKGMAFGNVVFGGIIGAGVDMSTGSAYDYPNPIVVEFQ